MKSKVDEANVRERILSFVREAMPHRASAVRPTDSMMLREDLGIDSMGMLSIAFRIEETFGLDMTPYAGELANIRRISDVVALTLQALHAGEPAS